ncbi:MAG: hypothetical protein WC755_04920 [Candidatus Woesearchaeota archaeon]|jgi:hypothetical protein
MSTLKHLMKLDHITFFLMLPSIILMFLFPSWLWFVITLTLWFIALAYDSWEHFSKK